MALVDPNIAMSFKPTTEYQPRNVLAEYAQLQQIQGGQMQLQDYQRKSEALERMRVAIRKAGGPDDLGLAAKEMMEIPEYFEQGATILTQNRIRYSGICQVSYVEVERESDRRLLKNRDYSILQFTQA